MGRILGGVGRNPADPSAEPSVMPRTRVASSLPIALLAPHSKRETVGSGERLAGHGVPPGNNL